MKVLIPKILETVKTFLHDDEVSQATCVSFTNNNKKRSKDTPTGSLPGIL